ncbi:MAG: iron-containing alcohol dehydrogenase [Oscillospiraceae bacterium]|nr:iron-containing alcohol dehydrogenase [Oscillospiraceae bacterium]
MEKFSCKTTILSGAGAICALGEMKGTRLFLVTDPFFVKNGMAQRVLEAAKCSHTEIFDKVQPDPTVELAAEGTARLRDFEADLLVALGGGSAMDCAKAMAYFAKGNYKFVAIPTTSGSGSEVTDFAILTHDKVKHPLVDPALRPDTAILDSDLLMELPRSLIADSGFDVLCHALEAYVAKDAGAISDLYAREAFSSAYASLPASYAGRKEVRLKVHVAATMAGMAFTQAGLGLCHALSHSLGGMFHVPHGRLNAILMPSIVSLNANAAGKKYAELARAAGLGGSAETIAVRNLKNGLVRLRRELGLPETLAQAGVPPRNVWASAAQIVQAALADPCCAANPVPVDDFMVRRILEEVTGRV